jgi:hypothetical protein
MQNSLVHVSNLQFVSTLGIFLLFYYFIFKFGVITFSSHELPTFA